MAKCGGTHDCATSDRVNGLIAIKVAIMAVIELKDLRFSFPDEWHDRTIIAVSAPANSAWKVTPNFVVTRDLALPGESLEAYTDRQLIELAKRLEEFKLFDRKPINVNGHTGVELRVTWKGGDQIVAQQQVIIMWPDQRVISFVSTAANTDFRRVSGVFAGILATVTF
jgi:hypothetical protein